MAPAKVELGIDDDGEGYYSAMLVEKYELDFTEQKSATSSEKSAKIEFIPNLEEFAARASAKIRGGGLHTSVPEGWPQSVNNRMTWTGKDFEGESQFVYQLSEEEKTEISLALQYFRGAFRTLYQ